MQVNISVLHVNHETPDPKIKISNCATDVMGGIKVAKYYHRYCHSGQKWVAVTDSAQALQYLISSIANATFLTQHRIHAADLFVWHCNDVIRCYKLEVLPVTHFEANDTPLGGVTTMKNAFRLKT